jgi:hypothetical protein
MLILAIDLGKAKSLACWYESDDATHEFRTVPTQPGHFHTLLTDQRVDRVVIEICDAAGWIVDLWRSRNSRGAPEVPQVRPKLARHLGSRRGLPVCPQADEPDAA